MSAAIEQAQEEVKPDMTPMIDCVFLLIIFFLCIDFRILESKLEAYLPKDKGSQTDIVEPQEQLSVKIVNEAEGTKTSRIPGRAPGDVNPKTNRPYPVKITGHRVFWQVGPRTINTIEDLNAEMKRIIADKSTWQVDKKTGNPKPIPIVIEPYPGTFYDDVAKTVDAVKDAKFEEVNFGGGLGPAPTRN
jgi:biopolymer transport protein ExbD